jgi:hypothetical protein
MKRDKVPFFIARIIDWRPVRWAMSVGDYDGRDRTIEVFDADAKDQRRLLAEIRKNARGIEEAVGGPLVVIFHSVKQTAERYSDFARSFPRPRKNVAGGVALPPERYVETPNENGPHRRAA